MGRMGVKPPCLPLATGQTVQHSGEKDDGYYEKGVSRRYVVLDSGQYSGSEDIVLNAKTHTLSNNCVIDKRTGLMWTRYVPTADIGPDNNGRLYWKEGADVEGIFRYKAKVKAARIGGHSGWRIPNLFELLSITDCSVSPPIDGTAFPSTPEVYHWTSTTAQNATTYALVINFVNFPGVGAQEKATYKAYCRLVRGPLGGEI